MGKPRADQRRDVGGADLGQHLDDVGADQAAAGGDLVATIGLRVSGDTRVVAADLAAVETVEYVVVTAGSFDLIVEVVCTDEAELLAVINDEIRSIDGVRETETFMHLHTEKNVFAWVQRLPRP